LVYFPVNNVTKAAISTNQELFKYYVLQAVITSTNISPIRVANLQVGEQFVWFPEFYNFVIEEGNSDKMYIFQYRIVNPCSLKSSQKTVVRV